MEQNVVVFDFFDVLVRQLVEFALGDWKTLLVSQVIEQLADDEDEPEVYS